MAHLNKVLLIGNLGKDPEIRVTQNGSKQARFSLATTERYKDKQTGEMKEVTQWHNVTGWRFVADLVERLNLTKGTSLYIEGKLQYRQWEDADGTKKYGTDVLLDSFQILTPKGQASMGDGQGSQAQPAPSYDQSSGYDPADDDMPF